jgi:hypothetical protein
MSRLKDGSIVRKKGTLTTGRVSWHMGVWGSDAWYSIQWESGATTDGLTAEELQRDYELADPAAPSVPFAKARYRRGDRLRDDRYGETGVVEDSYWDEIWKCEAYAVRWGRSGLVHHKAPEIDAAEHIAKTQTPPSLVGKDRGRCTCGAWTISWMEGHHDERCPEFRRS